MQKLIAMGRLTREVELRYTQSNTAVASFGLAVNRKFKREGEPDADFFNVTCFGKTAEFTSKWFTKGQQVLIIGSVQLNEWEDKNGNKRASLDLKAEEAYFAEGRSKTGGASFTELPDDGNEPF